ncbi:aspartyl-tRNA(Asn)/glutamyl-tRNA(Gln) amidotransferase subunit B [Ereboglobus sp. PH5-5]|uniref:Asp-tRNA(Asn)/Glu-tRNA(Gln) amidotransferase subunit GatB n=1 Tax=unclassified Ereboglobus TaxID=2626932 RepID=UPI0024052610|nr:MULTISPECIES: Asp-tRNA(Asn)/Glu-tRNA(Gln) amidotransferase subunit GatB [unclassified Ereboglobus]MDF9825930.1 aspartyl-tRNA(Asn)/glutamyl-tRNA(Gln) amidotransferase subunit B [Ereboglobus sp. PH5-10]MDF9833309.1 aspartyl-tRNA(Asn)/glutamyl-tRNA(Gln) amidotransferase subunit B [Ereboglobus sp. PH5-5]
MKYEAVIGLEVHIQLKTRTKMFTRAASGYGHEPNTLTDPVVLALPGALPVLNKAAIDQIIRAGLLVNCRIADECRWDRKNYFYPDSPKNYQLTQQFAPICLGGSVEIELPGSARNIMGEHKTIPLNRIHLEEDVGKLNHFATESLVDYNRAGTPLMELVTEPALASGDEAAAFLTILRATMQQGGVSDCDMEKGQMRCDANVSIRPVGSTALGTKVEMKNLNSISYVRDAIEHEIKRQTALVEKGGSVVQETRDYDGLTGVSQSLRTKEDAHDYRYFPDPDLMPVHVSAEWKNSLAATLPERPFDRQRRLMADHNLPYTITSVLIWDKPLADYYDAAVKLAGPDAPALAQPLGNWITNDLLRELGATKATFEEAVAKIPPAHLVALVKLIAAGTLTTNTAKEVFAEMFATGDAPEPIADRKNLKAVPTDANELEQWCRDAIAANAKAAEEFRAGKESAINGLKGPVMKASKGKANPKLVDETLRRLLAE